MIYRDGWWATPINWFFRDRWLFVGAALYWAAPTTHFLEIHVSRQKMKKYWYGRPLPASCKSQIFHVKSHATWLPGFEPVTLVPGIPSSNHSTQNSLMCILFRFTTYYPKSSINWLFEALNEFKWKSCQLQSFLTFWDLQLLFFMFVYRRWFKKFKFQILEIQT
jgi:hypothetical protein